MSIFGSGTSDFAPLSGEETIDTGLFNDIEVYNNIYLKEATDTYTGYNVPLITTNKTNDDMIFNTTTLSSNWDFTVGTGETTKESIFRINPTTGFHFEANNNAVNIDWNELSYLNGARSNIQTQLDNLDPDLSSNQGYWGNFWNPNTLTNPVDNSVNLVSFPSSDADNYGFSISNNNRVVASHAGIYMFIATIQINKSQGSTEEDVYFWIRKNGVDVADTGFKDSIKSEPKLICANWQLKLQATEYIQIAWSSPDIHVQLVAYTAGTTPTKPAIPSVILTASQISFLVDGGASLLPLTYTTGTNLLTCDASLNVNGFITTNKNPRYTGTTPLVSTSTNDYVPRAYISANFVNTSANQGVGGQKTFTSSCTFNQSLTINQQATLNRVIVLNDSSLNRVDVSGNLNVRGDSTTLTYLKTSGNIDCCGNLVVDCSSVVYDGTRNYGYYNIVRYIENENVVTRNFLGTLANNAVSIGNAAQTSANNAQNTANSAQNKANEAKSRADDAYDLATTAQATGTAAAAVAAAGVAAAASNAASIAGLTTAQATLAGTVGGIQTDLAEEQGKTQLMLPASIDTLRSKFYGRIAMYKTPLSLEYDIYLDPSGTSIFYEDLEAKKTFTARNVNLSAEQTQNLLGSTVNIADTNGTTNINCSTLNLGDTNTSTIKIGSTTSTINANVANLSLGNEALSTITIGSATSTANANVGTLNLGDISNSTITIGSSTSTVNQNVGTLNLGNVASSAITIGSSTSTITANVGTVNLGNVASSAITIGSSTSTLTANVSDLVLGNVSASNVRVGASNSNITIGGLTSAIYINGFLYIPFNPANFATALSQWT